MRKAFYNAKVYVEKGVYAQAVLVEDGIFKVVGTNEEVLKEAGAECEKYDCGGRTMIPGLNDSHMHLLSFGRTLQKAKIDDVKSIDEMIERCREFIKEYPERVEHGLHALGWNQDTFTEGEKRMPNRHDLDKISTEIPVIMERVCGHLVSTNTKAIEVLGFDKKVPEIPGGEVWLEEDGFPSGVFTENAIFVANGIIPVPTIEERQESLLEGMKYAVAHGLTSIQANDVGYPECKGEGAFESYSGLYESGKALVRFRHQNLFDSPKEFEEYLLSGAADKETHPWLTHGPLKLYKDGSLGARTAMVKDGYLDSPDNNGVSCITVEEMDEYCKLAVEHGVQVITHTIGDMAMNEVLDSYEKAFIDGENKLRHGLIHCQVTDEALINRIADNDILVLAQPIFMGSDMDVMKEIFEEKLTSTCLAFGTLLRKGVHLSYGTDCPVEDCNPFWNMHQAINRVDIQNKPEGGFYPKECVDVETAIDAYTYGSAYNEFKEDVKGRIKPGYYADLVVLDTDIFTCDPLTIKDILPVLTVVDGKTVYERI